MKRIEQVEEAYRLKGGDLSRLSRDIVHKHTPINLRAEVVIELTSRRRRSANGVQ